MQFLIVKHSPLPILIHFGSKYSSHCSQVTLARCLCQTLNTLITRNYVSKEWILYFIASLWGCYWVLREMYLFSLNECTSKTRFQVWTQNAILLMEQTLKNAISAYYISCLLYFHLYNVFMIIAYWRNVPYY